MTVDLSWGQQAPFFMAFGQNRPLEFIRRHSADRYDRLIPFIPHVLNSEAYPNLDAEMEETYSIFNLDASSTTVMEDYIKEY